MRNSLSLLLFLVVLGCSQRENAPDDSTNVVPPETKAHAGTEPVPAPSNDVLDPAKEFYELREQGLSSKWNLAKSPVTWSTLTIDSDDVQMLNGEWRRPQIGFLLRTSADVLKLAVKTRGEAVHGSGKPKSAVNEIDSHGWRIEVRVNPPGAIGEPFIRVSFIPSKFAD